MVPSPITFSMAALTLASSNAVFALKVSSPIFVLAGIETAESSIIPETTEKLTE